MINLSEVLPQIEKLAIKVGTMQEENLGRKDLKIQSKSSGIDLVTEIDQQSEKMILGFIREIYPDHAILAEESGRFEQDSEYLWIVDPLDGTTNYAQGLPIFSISIALEYQGETVLGVVYSSVTDQMFTAIKGQGAYLNGIRIGVSTKQELLDCVLATGFPYDITETPHNNIAYFNELVLKTRAVRRMGSAAYDLALVAAGRFDGFWEMNLSPWDVAAGMLLVTEAGGSIIHFRDDRKVSIICGNSVICQKVHDEIQHTDKKKAAQ
ncbi:MAG: inositol monophosphatase [Pelosinus sp.]|nr:inositol monophosphatase [Pelosinus sp.]